MQLTLIPILVKAWNKTYQHDKEPYVKYFIGCEGYERRTVLIENKST